MKAITHQIENFFKTTTRWIYHHARISLLIATLLFGWIWSSQLPKAGMDPSTEAFFHQDDPILLRYNKFRDQFGRDGFIMMAIETKDVFTTPFLEKLAELHQEIEETVPHLEDVDSLINARSTYGETTEDGEESLVIEDLLEKIPRTPEKLQELRKKVMENPFYINLVISEDGRMTTVVTKFAQYQDLTEEEEERSDNGEEIEPRLLTEEQKIEGINKIKELVEKYKEDGFQIWTAGSPIVEHDLKLAMQSNMARFMGLAVLSILFFLLFLFRRVTGMFYPIIGVVCALFSTVSLMAYLGITIKVPTQILPSFLLAVGVGASVHVLSVFYINLRDGHSQEEAIVEAMAHSALPVVMTSITTAASLWSFMYAEVAPIAELGIFAGGGVMFSLLTTLFLLPALIGLFPIKAKEKEATQPVEEEENLESLLKEGGKKSMMDRFLLGVAHFSEKNAPVILALSLVFFIGAGYGITKLNFSHNPIKWFGEEDPSRIASEFVDEKLNGSISLEILIDTGKENGLYDPEILKSLDKSAQFALNWKNEEGETFVGKVTSVVDMIKETHKALNGNQDEFYSISDDQKVVSQEFFLFENGGSEDLESVVDSQFQVSRITVRVPWIDAASYVKFVGIVDQHLKEEFGSRATVEVTGMLYLLTTSVSLMIQSTVLSYLIAGVVISILMVLLLGNIRLGLLSMYPNLFPIVLVLGMMGWLGISMDMFTLLIGSIAIGLVVDDTIHFMHNYRKYKEETGSAEKAIDMTLYTTGRAMIVTTFVLSTGFGIFMLSSMNNLFYFGWLTALALILALVADLVVAPSLMLVLDRKKDTAKTTEEEKVNVEKAI